LAYKWVPESPKWLKQMGRLEEAQAIIKEATDKRGLTRAASCGHDTVVEESIKGGRSVMFTADSTGKIPTEPRVKIKVEELFRRWIGSFWNLRKFGSLKVSSDERSESQKASGQSVQYSLPLATLFARRRLPPSAAKCNKITPPTRRFPPRSSF
jgi:hypothetical protein